MGFSRLRASLVSALIAIVLQGCASVTAHGVVKTAAGDPVGDASLTLSEESGTLTAKAETDLRGCFNVYQPVPGGDRSFVLHVSAPGYKSLDVTVRMQDRPILLVTLARDGSPGQSSSRLLEQGDTTYDVPCLPHAIPR